VVSSSEYVLVHVTIETIQKQIVSSAEERVLSERLDARETFDKSSLGIARVGHVGRKDGEKHRYQGLLLPDGNP
jgi:hypothetical protein